MCFAPYISLSTFIIEFLLAVFFLYRNPKDKLNQIIALISFLLGSYQLNEFLICTTSSRIFTILAMSVTSILPALGISYALVMWRKKLRYYWHILIYSPVIFFVSYFPFLYEKSAICKTIFIKYPGTGLIGDFFSLYYLLYLFGAIVLFYVATLNTNKKSERILLSLGMFSMFVFTIPTYIFLIFLPKFSTQFASVLCEFALLLAIGLIIILWYKEKHKIKFIS